MFVLILPWLLLALILLPFVFLFSKKGLLCLGSLIIVILLNNWAECVPLRLWKLSGESDGKCIKIMSFNIDGSSENIETRAHQIVDIINKKDPDVVFIAEYPEGNSLILDTLLRKDFLYYSCTNGTAHYFYSKYTLGGQLQLNDGYDKYGVYKSKVIINRDTINIYGCHFASNNYTEDKNYITPDSIDCKEDILTYMRDIEFAYRRRIKEANALFDDMRLLCHPVIVMGDFNDVGGSQAIRTMERCRLKDAWWVGGVGYGATIHRPLPYRIDHIMYSQGLTLQKVEIVSSKGLSDHDALYAEFIIN